MSSTLVKPAPDTFVSYHSHALPQAPSSTSFVTASPSSSPSPVTHPLNTVVPSSPTRLYNNPLTAPSTTIANDPTPLPPSRVLSLNAQSLPYTSSTLHAGSVNPAMSTASPVLESVQFSDAQGYIPILPRTVSPSAQYKKRCETCSTEHDGSFGAGRFCSSRCARTVGGLAHRKKRMQERDARQKICSMNTSAIAIHPVHIITKPRVQHHRHSSPAHLNNLTHQFQSYHVPGSSTDVSYLGSYGGTRSRRTAISINALLNPS